MDPRRGVKEGAVVRSADGEKLGKVIRCDDSAFIIEKGFFFPKDYLVRYDEVLELRDGEIFILSSREDLREVSEGEVAAGDTRAAPTAAGDTRAAPTEEEQRIPLAEEEMVAEKQKREAGKVRVKKTVSEVEKQITVPVTREEIHVETVPTSRTDATDASFREEEIVIPVHEEEIEIKKRPVVREEVRVRKSAVEEQRTASATVRKESAEVDEEGDVHRISDDPNKRQT